MIATVSLWANGLVFMLLALAVLAALSIGRGRND